MGHPVWVRKKAKTRGHVSLGCPKILEVPKSCAREKVGHPVTPARKVVARYAPSPPWGQKCTALCAPQAGIYSTTLAPAARALAPPQVPTLPLWYPAQVARGVQGTLPPPTPTRKCVHASPHPSQLNVTQCGRAPRGLPGLAMA